MTDTANPISQPAGPVSKGAVILVGLLGLSVPLFWLGLEELGTAWALPEYSHGPLIPLISLFLFLRELRDRPSPQPLRSRRVGPGITLGVVALLVAALGNLVAIPDIVAYGMILWIMAIVLVVMGWDDGRRHWAPVLHLIFMLPLPQMLYWQVTTGLQTVSAELGVWLVRSAGVPVFLQGHIIDLGVYKLQVAEACAGLRYLFPILSFSYLVAILYRGPLWHKATIFLLAAPIAVVLNAVRIGVIGILVDRYGISHAEGFLHIFEGWVVFGLCLLVLAAVAWLLSRFRPERGVVLDLDTAGLGQQVLRIRRVGQPVGLGVMAGMLLWSLAVLSLRPPSDPVLERVPFVGFQMDLGGWTGHQVSLPPSVAALLGADDYLDAVFQHSGHAAPVLLFSAWYANQNGGDGIHSPEVCLPAGGWEIAELSRAHPTFLAGTEVNRAIVRQGLQAQLVYYWFEQRGHRMAGDWDAKLNAIHNHLTTGRSDGALVRLTTPILPDEDIAQAEARLQDLAREALPHLKGHLPP